MGNQQDFLRQRFLAGTLAHAYLFEGPREAGVAAASDLVKNINCRSGGAPCGTCRNCLLIAKESFPDVLAVRSSHSESSLKNKEDSLEIDVTQARGIQHFLSYKSYYGGWKAVVVEDAERMNEEAQNCILKTLEEPRGASLILLLSSKPDLLLPTVRSRCQQIKFFQKDAGVFSQDEQKLLGELLRVLRLPLAGKFLFAKNLEFKNTTLTDILNVLQKYFRQILLANVGVGESHLAPDKLNVYSISKLRAVLATIEKLRRLAATTNASPKLALELLLLDI